MESTMFNKPYSWVEISKSAFDHNVQTYRSILGPDRQLSVVIKSNAYGHDTATMSQLCQDHPQVNWLCINSLSEALIARKIGVTKPILVISNIDENPGLAIDNSIDLIAYSMKQITQLNTIAQQKGRTAAIHLKIDTGMSRLGFFPEEFLKHIDAILNLEYIKVRGIFSHFAESSKDDLSYTHYQANCFEELLVALKQRSITIPLRHLANSAGITTACMDDLNMVRLGAGAYGLYPSPANMQHTQTKHPNFKLTPILSWKTRIMHIKNIPSGRYVGYSRTYTTNRETTIGFLPVGHHEGLDRTLSNAGAVWLSKQQTYAPIIGMICLNMTMIDLTDISSIEEGDEVVLIGPQNSINVEKRGQQIGTANLREITGRIAASIARIIVP